MDNFLALFEADVCPQKFLEQLTLVIAADAGAKGVNRAAILLVAFAGQAKGWLAVWVGVFGQIETIGQFGFVDVEIYMAE